VTAPAELAALAGRIAQATAQLAAGGDDGARAAAATELAALEQALAGIDRGAVGGLDLAQLGEALRVFGAWLRAPTPAGEATAQAAMADLQAQLGPLIGWDPAREDAARRAQYRQEARAALDEIFARPAKS
jgi:hypothetical protein